MLFQIMRNEGIAPSVYRMVLSGDTSGIRAPGQFVNIQIDELYLRRPISVCDWDEDSLTLIYKVVGKGTLAMRELQPGAELDLLTGLGNGYDISVNATRPLLMGGGVGIPPLYGLLKRIGAPATVILGFNTKSEVFYEEEFKALGAEVIVCTADGSYGTKGFVTAPMEHLSYDHFFACGPEPMLRAVCEKSSTSGQLSFEQRMACGFGACMGCSCRTRTGNKRICKDGPVLRKEEILWQS